MGKEQTGGGLTQTFQEAPSPEHGNSTEKPLDAPKLHCLPIEHGARAEYDAYPERSQNASDSSKEGEKRGGWKSEPVAKAGKAFCSSGKRIQAGCQPRPGRCRAGARGAAGMTETGVYDELGSATVAGFDQF